MIESKVGKNMNMKIVENIMPILHVKDLDKSIEYYQSKLGFKPEWTDKLFAGVYKDGFGIMLYQDEESKPQQVWIGIHKLETLYDEFIKAQVNIVQYPQNNRWAYDMKVQDLDGNILWFGAEPKKE